MNVTTAKDDGKLVQVACWVKSLNQAICFVSETHRTGLGITEQWPIDAELDGWRFINSGLKKKAMSGVGILISPEVRLIDYDEIEPGRILQMRLKFRGVKLLCFAVYGPTNVQCESAKSGFFNKLSRSLITTKAKYPKWKRLIGGDFNAALGRHAPTSRFVTDLNLDTCPTTDNGYRFVEFLNRHELYALNTQFQTRNADHRITFTLGRARKRLDYLVSDLWLRRTCMNARAYTLAKV